ncbi:MAG: hypothetical protein NZM94_03535, partial [Roseiflexus sp.]|nr:hypothetical protein [Roseiflexus sp.]
MEFEKIIRYRRIEPAKAGFATVACDFRRRAGMRIEECLYLSVRLSGIMLYQCSRYNLSVSIEVHVHRPMPELPEVQHAADSLGMQIAGVR